mgnify:CR=1 FL=1
MRIDVLGVGFDNLTLEEAVEAGMDLVRTPGAHYVVTPNPEIVEVCREDPAVMDIVNRADLVLADGIGVIKGAAMLGTPLKGKVPGIEFAAGLLGKLAKEGRSVYLLGAKPGVAEQAGENLKKRYPDLLLCGTHDGYFQADGPVVDQIRAARADVVFVCLGAPKQERWMAQYGPETGAHLMVGLGGVLDVYAGHVKRAPEIWQKLGLEWCYRLLHQPSRLGRMAKLPLFLLEAAREKGKRGKP